ncbi:MAG: hypothetical protein ACRYG8_44010 [Janthinobacterium lividum]
MSSPDTPRRQLWLLSAGVQKNIPGATITSHLHGYRLCVTEGEARGSFLITVMAEKPGFSITEMLCSAIPDNALQAALEGGPNV